jgi:hypothetical protein
MRKKMDELWAMGKNYWYESAVKYGTSLGV